jgi:YfiH family protein
VIRWEIPEPYRVAFTTRIGGVSEGAFAALNLGKATNDSPERVDENRRRACAAVDADPERLTLNYQHHSATVHRAEAGRKGVRGDGLWTDEPGIPMLKLTADCVPIAIARAGGKPALALLHAGWRGVLEGIVEAGAAAIGDGSLRAIVGPAIGPCCYEVGRDVAESFTARYGPRLMRGRNLDLWEAAERALRRAGCANVHRFDLCTKCNADLFFSERRTGRPRGTHGVIGLVTR